MSSCTCVASVWLEKSRLSKFWGSLPSLTVCFHLHSWPFLWQPMHAKPTVHVGKNLGCFAVDHNSKARALFHLRSETLSQVLMHIFTWNLFQNNKNCLFVYSLATRLQFHKKQGNTDRSILHDTVYLPCLIFTTTINFISLCTQHT